LPQTKRRFGKAICAVHDGCFGRARARKTGLFSGTVPRQLPAISRADRGCLHLPAAPMVAVGRRASLTQAELCREPTEVPVGLLVEIGPLKLHIEGRHDRRVAPARVRSGLVSGKGIRLAVRLWELKLLTASRCRLLACSRSQPTPALYWMDGADTGCRG
jgi:hypothetical protein